MSDANINYKDGDKLLCVRDKKRVQPIDLIEGEIYTFDGITNEYGSYFVMIKEIKLDSFYPDRFISAVPYVNEQKLRKKLGLL